MWWIVADVQNFHGRWGIYSAAGGREYLENPFFGQKRRLSVAGMVFTKVLAGKFI